MKTLEKYFKKEFERSGVIDFVIRIQPTGRTMTGSGSPDSRLSFYIHPSGKDGDTMDYWVEGNKLTPPLELMSLYQETIHEAIAGEYHDFKNDKYPCGKVAVVGRLQKLGFNDLAKRVMQGEFDEKPDADDVQKMRNDVIMNTKSKAEANAMIKNLKLGDPI